MDQQLEKLPLSQELLNYYRERLKKCEQDYQDALSHIDTIRIQHDEVHRTSWEAHKRAGEMADLQKALSDAEVALFEEKRNVLKLLAENDELKVQELKDRKKIRYLLKVSPCPEEETTYFRDQLDKRLIRVTRADCNAATASGKPGQIVCKRSEERNIVILEDEVEALKLTVTSLRTQLDEQAKSYQGTIAGLLRDRQTQMEEERARREHEAQKSSDLMDKVQKLRALCRENIRELLHTKKAAHSYERRLVEDKTALIEELHTVQNQLFAEKNKAESAEKTIESKVTKKQESLVTELRTQLGKYEREVQENKAKAEESEKALKKRIDYLQSRLAAISSSYTALKRRRDYEIEGFTNDILMLRKQLRKLERNILKYAPLEDRELRLLNLAKETGQRAARLSSDLHGLKAKVYATEREVQSLAF